MASTSHQQLLRPLWGGAAVLPSKAALPFRSPSRLPSLPLPRRRRLALVLSRAKGSSDMAPHQQQQQQKKKSSEEEEEKEVEEKEDEEVEVEEDLPWIQEKALDLVEFTGSVTQAIPGPRVGQSNLPWLLAVPLSYVGITFVIAFVRTVRRFTSPRARKKRLVNKNAALLKSMDELLLAGRDSVGESDFEELMNKTGFSAEDILRKYIRYALNEKPFKPDVVMDLISIRKNSGLNDPQVAEVLNEVSRRIVRDKGPVVMDISGFTERGFKRKLAVQALFGKMLYLSELPEFCSRDSSLLVKEIFGATDEDADTLRIHTLSESGDVDSLEKMVESSDSENPGEGSSEQHS